VINKIEDWAERDILTFDISDVALEAAAGSITDRAMSFGAPTVNILVLCCGGDSITGSEQD
jgi:hypothetical protein